MYASVCAHSLSGLAVTRNPPLFILLALGKVGRYDGIVSMLVALSRRIYVLYLIDSSGPDTWYAGLWEPASLESAVLPP